MCMTLLWALLLASTPPSGPALVRIEILPSSLRLQGPDSRRQLLVNGIRRDGLLVDLTHRVRWSTPGPGTSAVSVDTEGVARPVRDGRARIQASFGGLSAQIPVTVTQARRPVRWTFENHVLPVLARQSCNSGPCHGAGGGKGGFKLSLRGYDPAWDYARITRDGRGRRISRANPAESLLLKKPSLSLPHVGGLRLRRDSDEYRTLFEWIRAGAPGPSDKTPKLLALSVSPSDRTLLPDGSQQLAVTARFSDGSLQDVTHRARYWSNEEPVAQVDESGLIQMRKPGETAVTVWYQGRVAFARVRVPFANGVSDSDYAVTPAKSFIDRHVLAKLKQMRLLPSPRCSDAEFVRRVFLDTLGILPAPHETQAFVTDSAPNKREKLIEALLDRPEYVDHWSYRWADLLRVNRDLIGGKGMWAFHSWLRECVSRNVGWDRIAREILTASGNAAEVGPANFYRQGARPEEFAETVSQAFLGIRVQCAKCHNHPFEKWTQDDYYRMANLFARVRRKKDQRAGGELVYVSARGDVDHPRLRMPLEPAAYDGPRLALQDERDRREYLADWMTSPSNPYFARSIVNRVWKQYMGRGLVEPVDDMRLTNPASNEPLMRALTRFFVESGFDLKRLTRAILLSDTYQRSSRPIPANAADDRFYSRYVVRRLPAETLLDAIGQVTGRPEKFEGAPPGVRAIALPDTRVPSPFLDLFGRPARQVTCECERSADSSVPQALHLVSADSLNARLAHEESTAARLIRSGLSDEAILEELYLACLSRPATAPERSVFRQTMAAALEAAGQGDRNQARRQVFADVLWGLLCSPEFLFNH